MYYIVKGVKRNITMSKSVKWLKEKQKQKGK